MARHPTTPRKTRIGLTAVDPQIKRTTREPVPHVADRSGANELAGDDEVRSVSHKPPAGTPGSGNEGKYLTQRSGTASSKSQRAHRMLGIKVEITRSRGGQYRATLVARDAPESPEYVSDPPHDGGIVERDQQRSLPLRLLRWRRGHVRGGADRGPHERGPPETSARTASPSDRLPPRSLPGRRGRR